MTARPVAELVVSRDAPNVFVFDERGITAGVPAKLRAVPYIIQPDGIPAREYNQYLFHRFHGSWNPQVRYSGINALINGRPPRGVTTIFLLNRAYQLNAFRRWCERTGLSLSCINEDILVEYLELLYARVAKSTAQQHLIAIVDFLEFTASAGYRGPFQINREATKKGSQKRGTPTMLGRQNPPELDKWYLEEEVARFVNHLETSADIIAAKIMYRMGLRLQETLTLSIGPFLQETAHRSSKALFTIRIIGKGGKLRVVPVPADLLKEIRQYILVDRQILQRKFKFEHDVLLVIKTPTDARPVAKRSLQKRFKKAAIASGMTLITPHILRHHFAAFYLLRAWKRKTSTSSGDIIGDGKIFLSTDLTSLMQILGHGSFDTTCRYLHALNYFFTGEMYADYSDALDGE